MATLDWVTDHVHGSVLDVGPDNDVAVMGAAWALGFAGATRVQVWWVLHDQRLRTAFAALCRAMTRVHGAEVPSWLQPVTRMTPADRAALAARVEQLRAAGTTLVPAADELLFAVVRDHGRAVAAPDGVSVPDDALDELVALAGSVTQTDIERLLDRARPPFQRRLDEAAAVAAEKGLAFLVRKAHSAA